MLLQQEKEAVLLQSEDGLGAGVNAKGYEKQSAMSYSSQ